MKLKHRQKQECLLNEQMIIIRIQLFQSIIISIICQLIVEVTFYFNKKKGNITIEKRKHSQHQNNYKITKNGNYIFIQDTIYFILPKYNNIRYNTLYLNTNIY
ncbi:hypothetical protein pb186bvf_011313 [Paramecium bursaria]